MKIDSHLSKCHKAPVKIVGGIGDFSDHEEGITMHYECSKCGEACDLLATTNIDSDGEMKDLLTIAFGQLMIRSENYPNVGQLVAKAMPLIKSREATLQRQAELAGRADELNKLAEWGKTIDDQWNDHFRERLAALKEQSK